MGDTLTKTEVITLCDSKSKELREKILALQEKSEAMEIQAKVWESTKEEIVKMFDKK